MSENKYRISWWKTKKNASWQSHQEVVVFGEDAASHILTHLEKDDKVNTISVIPVS